MGNSYPLHALLYLLSLVIIACDNRDSHREEIEVPKDVNAYVKNTEATDSIEIFKGFQGATLHTPVQQFNDQLELKINSKADLKKIYIPTKNKLLAGDVKLKSLEYHFYDDSLMSIVVNVENDTSNEASESEKNYVETFQLYLNEAYGDSEDRGGFIDKALGYKTSFWNFGDVEIYYEVKGDDKARNELIELIEENKKIAHSRKYDVDKVVSARHSVEKLEESLREVNYKLKSGVLEIRSTKIYEEYLEANQKYVDEHNKAQAREALFK